MIKRNEIADPNSCLNKAADPVGRRFGQLTVIAEAGRDRNNGSILWRCLCSCGNETVVPRFRLGKTLSCGCLQKEFAISGAAHLRHGHAKKAAPSPTYRCWAEMFKRCENPKHNRYPRYGGRGISVCDRWRLFENFLADVGERPSRSFSLDRYPNNDGNYEPGNVRWATAKEQANNRKLPD